MVVLLVIAMLTAVGVVATRSSQLGVVNAGRYRESTQTHYVAEAGIQGVVAEVAKNPGLWVTRLEHADGLSTAVSRCSDLPAAAPVSTSCLRLGYDFLEEAHRLETGVPTAKIFEDKSVAGPGSFGNAAVRGNFGVELTDPREVFPPPAGFVASRGTGGGAALRFVSVSMRGVGQIVPLGAADPNSTATRFMQSVETLRAEAVFGPVP